MTGRGSYLQVMCEVKASDIADHVRARLEKEHAEKERKRLDKAEAHKFTFLRIATDKDLADQIGKDRYFDLVDHEKVCEHVTCRTRALMCTLSWGISYSWEQHCRRLS